MADQLFTDSVMELSLEFRNRGKQGMADAEKMLGEIDLRLYNLIKSNLKAGTSFAELSYQAQRALPAIKALAAESAGVDSKIFGQLAKSLSRYTPERVQLVGKFDEMRQASGATESSGTAALRATFTEYLRLRNVEARKGKEAFELYRATGSSTVGRGLMLDLEVARIPKTSPGYPQEINISQAMVSRGRAIVEAAAIQFTFNKKTGQLIDAEEQLYHAFVDATKLTKEWILPHRVTREMSASGPQLNPRVLAAMAARSDFLVGHNVRNFDQPIASVLIPKLRGMPTIDSQRDIPLRELGYSDKRLQSVLRVLGIDPGQSHRATDDARANIKFLGSSPVRGGPTFMSMALAAHGEVTPSQELATQYRLQANQYEQQIVRQIGEAPRYGYPQPRIKYFTGKGVPAGRPLTANLADDYARNLSAQQFIESIGYRDAEWNEAGNPVRGIRGSGGMPEPTPQSGIVSIRQAAAVAHQLATVRQFSRNQLIYSGPAASEEFNEMVAEQAAYQAKLQELKSRKRRPAKDEVRFGEAIDFHTMAGVNTLIRNRELEGEVRRPPSNPDVIAYLSRKGLEGFERKLLPSARGVGAVLNPLPNREQATARGEAVFKSRVPTDRSAALAYFLAKSQGINVTPENQFDIIEEFNRRQAERRAAVASGRPLPIFGKLDEYQSQGSWAAFHSRNMVQAIGGIPGYAIRSEQVLPPPIDAEPGYARSIAEAERRQKMHAPAIVLNRNWLGAPNDWGAPIDQVKRKFDKVYLDMDGVLSDFDAGLTKLSGKVYNSEKGWYKIQPDDWKKVLEQKDFWRNLPKMQDADEIFQKAQNLGKWSARGFSPSSLEILSSSSGDPNATEQKTEWVKKHFGNIPVTVVASSSEKMKYANPNSALIDDLKDSVEKFTLAGGTGILHRGKNILTPGRRLPFDEDEINALIEQHIKSGKVGNPGIIQRAAQMANAVGEKDARYPTLVEAMYAGQAAARARNRAQLLLTAQSTADSDWTPDTSGSFKSRRASRVRQFLADESGSATVGGASFGLNRVGEFLKNFFSSAPSTNVARDPVAELKQMRRDDAIARLYTSANKAAATLEAFEAVVRPQKTAQAQARFNAAQEKAAQGLEQETAKVVDRGRTQQERLQSRIAALGVRSERAGANYDVGRSRLLYSEFQAQLKLEDAVTRQTAALSRLKQSKAYDSAPEAGKEAMRLAIEGPLRRAQLDLGVAQFKRQAFEAESPDEITALKKRYATQIAATLKREKPGTPEYAAAQNRYADMLGVPPGGLASTNAELDRLQSIQREQAQKQVDVAARVSKQKEEIRQKYATGALKGEDELAAKVASIEQAGAAQHDRAEKLKSSAAAREARLRERFALEDEAAGGGGAGGRSRGARASGGSFGGGARGGLDFGLGLAAFAGASVALRELTLETTQYAARTQQLKVVTEQMARTNFVAVDSIGAYVNVMKGQNQTTQSAYSTVQRMIQAQFDISKAPALSRAAQNLSTLTGADPSETLDRIMMGLVTGYTRQLHMAGLQVSRLSVNRQLRGELGREPSDFEQRQGLLNATLVESARTSGTYEQSLTTAAGQMSRLSVQAQETKNAIGNQFLPIYARGIQLVSSGLKTIQENPTGASRGIAGGLSVGSTLATLGTAAFLRWAGGAVLGSIGQMTPIGRVATIGTSIAAGYGMYRQLTQDQGALKVQAAKDSIKEIDQARSALRDVGAAPPGASADTLKQLDFEHKMYVESEKGYASSRLAVQRNLTNELAEIYLQQVKDFEDFSSKANKKQGYGGWMQGLGTGIVNLLTTGKFAGAGTMNSNMASPQMAPPKPIPELGITTQDQLNAIEDARRRAREALHPDLAVSKRQLEVAQAMSSIQQAGIELDKLDRGFEPGGKEARATRRARNADNPLGLIQAEVADFEAQMREDLPHAIEVLKKRQLAEPGNLDLQPAINQGILALAGRDEAIRTRKREADEQSAALYRKRDQQLRANEANTDVARIMGAAVPGNYASEAAASQAVLLREQRRAQEDFASHLNPIQRDVELSVAQNRFAQDEIARETNQRNATRSRQESVIMYGGQFAAQAAMNDPRLSVQEALIKGYAEEMRAAQQLSNDEERRNEQLKLTLSLRTALVDAARREASEVAAFDVAKRGNQVNLQETVDRIIAGRGPRSQDQQVLDSIERRRRLDIDQARYEYDRLLKTGGAGDEATLGRRRDLEIDRANKQAQAATVEQLDSTERVRRQELALTYQRQGERALRVGALQATGPAEEVANIQNAHNIRMEFIRKEFAASHQSADDEKKMRLESLDSEFQYVEKILALRKQRSEEARGIAGGLFDALASSRSNPQAFPDFFRSFILGQARTMAQNFAGPVIDKAMGGMSGIFSKQFTTDAQGRQVPTTLGRILGGTVFGKIPGDDPQKLLANITKESVDAERDLKKSVDDLNDTIKGIKDGMAKESSGGAGAAGGISAATGLASRIFPGLGPLIQTGTALMRVPQVAGLFKGASGAGASGSIAALLKGRAAEALESMDPALKAEFGLGPPPPPPGPRGPVSETSQSFGFGSGGFSGGQAFIGAATEPAVIRTIRELNKPTTTTAAAATVAASTVAKSVHDLVVRIPRFVPGSKIQEEQPASRNNNPGNLRYVGQAGAAQGVGGFAKFPTAEAGYAAVVAQAKLDASRGATLEGYIAKYAPPSENNTAAYVANAVKALGVPASTPLSQVDLQRLAQFQVKQESSSRVERGSALVSVMAGGGSGFTLNKALIGAMADSGPRSSGFTLNKALIGAMADAGPSFGSGFSLNKALIGAPADSFSVPPRVDLPRTIGGFGGMGIGAGIVGGLGVLSSLAGMFQPANPQVNSGAAEAMGSYGENSASATMQAPRLRLKDVVEHGGETDFPGATAQPTSIPIRMEVPYRGGSTGAPAQPQRSILGSMATGFGAFGNALGGGGDISIVDAMRGYSKNTAYADTGRVNLSSSQRIGAMAGKAATALGGVEMGLHGISRGGAKGGLQAASGFLAAASVIPGPQQPFIAAAAAVTGLVSSLFGDPKVIRQAQIEEFLQKNKYRSPVSLDATVAASGGNVVSEGLSGLGVNSGLAAFPFNVQQNQLLAQSNPSFLDKLLGYNNATNSLYPYAQGYNFIPGRQLAPSDLANPANPYALGPGSSSSGYISPSAMVAQGSGGVTHNWAVNIPISAFDASDVLRRSGDIAAAFRKEMLVGGGTSDLSSYVNNAIFGGG